MAGQSRLPKGLTSEKRAEEVNAVDRLIPAFRAAHGVELHHTHPDPDDRDADVIALAAGEERGLRFQIVRPRDSNFWREQRTRHEHTDEIYRQELYELLLSTLELKRTRAVADVILVMDIWPHVHFVFVQEFKGRHQVEIDAIAFAEIWWSGREEPYVCLKRIGTDELPWIKANTLFKADASGQGDQSNGFHRDSGRCPVRASFGRVLVGIFGEQSACYMHGRVPKGDIRAYAAIRIWLMTVVKINPDGDAKSLLGWCYSSIVGAGSAMDCDELDVSSVVQGGFEEE